MKEFESAAIGQRLKSARSEVVVENREGESTWLSDVHYGLSPKPSSPGTLDRFSKFYKQQATHNHKKRN